MAKKGQVYKKYSPKFKLSVILDMRSNYLTYIETVLKYNLVNRSFGGALQTIQRWERKYLEMGELGLMQENRGRPRLDGKKRGRPLKLDKQVEQDLIAENQQLRMETEYLKKLSALVLAEEREKDKKR